MADVACTPTPTLTEFETITSFALTTAFSTGTSVLKDVLTTITTTSCLGGAVGIVNGTCLLPTTVTEVQTITGTTSTFTVPLTSTITNLKTEATATLFGTCSSNTTTTTTTTTSSSTTTTTSSSTTTTTSSTTTTSTSNSSTVQSSSATPPPLVPANHPSSSVSFSTFVSTPPPTTLTTVGSTTLSNGQVVPTKVTVVFTPPPVTSVSALPPHIQNNDNDGGSDHSKSSLGLILGSLFGGCLALFAVVGLAWFLRKRLRRNPWTDALGEKGGAYADTFSPDVRRRPLSDSSTRPVGPVRLLSDEPKPYQYGIVGHVLPAFADDGASSVTSGHPTPLPSPGLLGPAAGSGRLTPLHTPSPPQGHSPAPSLASEALLLPRLGSPPASVPTSPIPAPAAARRRSTSLSIGTPQSSFIRPGPLTLANWDPSTDGMLADMDSVDDIQSAVSRPARSHSRDVSKS